MQDKLITSFSRIISKKLSKTQKNYLNNDLPKYLIDLDQYKTPKDNIWLEIGFGSGEHLASQAALNPKINFIGCEPFLNGVANLLKLIEEQNILNINIWQKDARLLLESMDDESVNKIFILFPDPWPKTRHHKRRLVSNQTLDLLAKKIEKAGQLIVATDHNEYAYVINKILHQRDDFFTVQTDHNTQPDNWIKTKYQEKALDGEAQFFVFNKK